MIPNLKSFTHSLGTFLKIGEGPVVYGAKEVGTGAVDEKVPLSTLIEILNERFGTEFTAADQLFFEQVKETAINNEELIGAARANTLENFKYIFNKMLESLFVERMDGNEEIFVRLMNDDDFKRVAAKFLVRDVYNGILERDL
jgi:type I restriction enzyme R subunit